VEILGSVVAGTWFSSLGSFHFFAGVGFGLAGVGAGGGGGGGGAEDVDVLGFLLPRGGGGGGGVFLGGVDPVPVVGSDCGLVCGLLPRGGGGGGGVFFGGSALGGTGGAGGLGLLPRGGGTGGGVGLGPLGRGGTGGGFLLPRGGGTGGGVFFGGFDLGGTGGGMPLLEDGELIEENEFLTEDSFSEWFVAELCRRLPASLATRPPSVKTLPATWVVFSVMSVMILPTPDLSDLALVLSLLPMLPSLLPPEVSLLPRSSAVEPPECRSLGWILKPDPGLVTPPHEH
jgi:hypothetical protein